MNRKKKEFIGKIMTDHKWAFICDVCVCAFRSAYAIDQHCRDTHHRSIIACPICNKRFNSFQSLQQHKKQCSVKSFAQKKAQIMPKKKIQAMPQKKPHPKPTIQHFIDQLQEAYPLIKTESSIQGSSREQIALFWDLENIPLPRQTSHRMIDAIGQFCKHNDVQKAFVVYRPQKTSPQIISQFKENLPMVGHCTTDSDKPNAVDKALLTVAFQTLSQTPTINTVYLLTGDQDYRKFLRILEDAHIQSILICRSSNYGLKLANPKQKIRYLDALIKHPTCWWYPSDHPKSIASIHNEYIRLIRMGAELLAHTLDTEKITLLIQDIDSKTYQIRKKILEILCDLSKKYKQGRKRKQLFAIFKDILPIWLEREIADGNIELVDIITQNLI